MLLKAIHLNILSPRRSHRQKNISRTNQATLTQQILPGYPLSCRSHSFIKRKNGHIKQDEGGQRRRRAGGRGDAGGMDRQKMRKGCGAVRVWRRLGGLASDALIIDQLEEDKHAHTSG